jgi:hypothetical protein
MSIRCSKPKSPGAWWCSLAGKPPSSSPSIWWGVA